MRPPSFAIRDGLSIGWRCGTDQMAGDDGLAVARDVDDIKPIAVVYMFFSDCDCFDPSPRLAPPTHTFRAVGHAELLGWW